LEAAQVRKPIVVRMVGTREEEAKKLLSKAGLIFSSSMEEAVQLAVEIASKAEVKL
jgi:succinyl-CoA synthetase beta subunit